VKDVEAVVAYFTLLNVYFKSRRSVKFELPLNHSLAMRSR